MIKNFKNKMMAKDGKLSGGFTSLNKLQLSKIRGGQKDAECENTSYVNGSCGGEANRGYCVNGNC